MDEVNGRAHGRERALESLAARAREEDEARRRRAQTDVEYGAAPEQVPQKGWMP